MSDSRCDVCGAPRMPGAPCRYCSTGNATFSLGGLARAAEQDRAMLEEMLPALARDLDEALPGKVEIDAAHAGRFGRGALTLRRLRVVLGDQRFLMERRDGRFVATIEMYVRGISLKRDEVTPAQWVQRLADALATYASDAGMAPAFVRLLGR